MANYGLTAIQVGFGTGTRKLQIQWSATLPYEATLTVTRGVCLFIQKIIIYEIEY
ncbi:hypothetical protein [Metasolibacillus sp. FSL K6-0083]|uniref:hypothetical protein n=1 Tax=Metasolibacillus sp. FSL K6-0083 TaxID=2921416 RepID=UPI00315B033D